MARRSSFWFVTVVVSGTCIGALSQALSGLLEHRPWNWGAMAVVGLFAGVVLPIVVWLQLRGTFFAPPNEARRRRLAGMAVVAAGVLPPDADPDEWSVRLREARDELRWNRWMTAGLFVVVGVFVGAAAARENANAPAVWTLAVGLTVFAVVPFWIFTRRLPAAGRLSRQLAEG